MNGWIPGTIQSGETGEEYRYLRLSAEKPDAPVLVLIHGLSMNMRMFLHCTPLAREFETYSLELPHDSSLYTGHISDFRRVVTDFTSALGLDRFLLGGVSFGGVVSFDYFHSQESERVIGLVLISTNVPNGTPRLRRRNQRTFGLLNGLRDRQILCVIQRAAEREMEETIKDPEGGPGEHNVMGIWYLKPVEYYRQVLLSVKNVPADHPGNKVSCPTIVMHGSADGTVPLKQAELTTSLISGAELQVYEGYDHDMAYRHGERIAEDIVTWWVQARNGGVDD